MSTCQLKKTLICAEPRLVAERTVTAPGMSFIASSIGRVTVAIISSAGMMPLFTRMTTRGKFVCGNTDDGICSAQKIPARHNAAAMNVMDSACCVANRPRGEMASGFIWRPANWWTFRRPENFGRGFLFSPAGRKRRRSRQRRLL